MSAIWQYPPHIMAELQKPVPKAVHEAAREALRKRHEETLARIDARIADEVALREERAKALAWCRANGNPHLKETPA